MDTTFGEISVSDENLNRNDDFDKERLFVNPENVVLNTEAVVDGSNKGDELPDDHTTEKIDTQDGNGEQCGHMSDSATSPQLKSCHINDDDNHIEGNQEAELKANSGQIDNLEQAKEEYVCSVSNATETNNESAEVSSDACDGNMGEVLANADHDKTDHAAASAVAGDQLSLLHPLDNNIDDTQSGNVVTTSNEERVGVSDESSTASFKRYDGESLDDFVKHPEDVTEESNLDNIEESKQSAVPAIRSHQGSSEHLEQNELEQTRYDQSDIIGAKTDTSSDNILIADANNFQTPVECNTDNSGSSQDNIVDLLESDNSETVGDKSEKLHADNCEQISYNITELSNRDKSDSAVIDAAESLERDKSMPDVDNTVDLPVDDTYQIAVENPHESLEVDYSKPSIVNSVTLSAERISETVVDNEGDSLVAHNSNMDLDNISRSCDEVFRQDQNIAEKSEGTENSESPGQNTGQLFDDNCCEIPVDNIEESLDSDNLKTHVDNTVTILDEDSEAVKHNEESLDLEMSKPAVDNSVEILNEEIKLASFKTVINDRAQLQAFDHTESIPQGLGTQAIIDTKNDNVESELNTDSCESAADSTKNVYTNTEELHSDVDVESIENTTAVILQTVNSFPQVISKKSSDYPDFDDQKNSSVSISFCESHDHTRSTTKEDIKIVENSESTPQANCEDNIEIITYETTNKGDLCNSKMILKNDDPSENYGIVDIGQRNEQIDDYNESPADSVVAEVYDGKCSEMSVDSSRPITQGVVVPQDEVAVIATPGVTAKPCDNSNTSASDVHAGTITLAKAPEESYEEKPDICSGVVGTECIPAVNDADICPESGNEVDEEQADPSTSSTNNQLLSYSVNAQEKQLDESRLHTTINDFDKNHQRKNSGCTTEDNPAAEFTGLDELISCSCDIQHQQVEHDLKHSYLEVDSIKFEHVTDENVFESDKIKEDERSGIVDRGENTVSITTTSSSDKEESTTVIGFGATGAEQKPILLDKIGADVKINTEADGLDIVEQMDDTKSSVSDTGDVIFEKTKVESVSKIESESDKLELVTGSNNNTEDNSAIELSDRDISSVTIYNSQVDGFELISDDIHSSLGEMDEGCDMSNIGQALQICQNDEEKAVSENTNLQTDSNEKSCGIENETEDEFSKIYDEHKTDKHNILESEILQATSAENAIKSKMVKEYCENGDNESKDVHESDLVESYSAAEKHNVDEDSPENILESVSAVTGVLEDENHILRRDVRNVSEESDDPGFVRNKSVSSGDDNLTESNESVSRGPGDDADDSLKEDNKSVSSGPDDDADDNLTEDNKSVSRSLDDNADDNLTEDDKGVSRGPDDNADDNLTEDDKSVSRGPDDNADDSLKADNKSVSRGPDDIADDSLTEDDKSVSRGPDDNADDSLKEDNKSVSRGPDDIADDNSTEDDKSVSRGPDDNVDDNLTEDDKSVSRGLDDNADDNLTESQNSDSYEKSLKDSVEDMPEETATDLGGEAVHRNITDVTDKTVLVDSSFDMLNNENLPTDTQNYIDKLDKPVTEDSNEMLGDINQRSLGKFDSDVLVKDDERVESQCNVEKTESEFKKSNVNQYVNTDKEQSASESYLESNTFENETTGIKMSNENSETIDKQSAFEKKDSGNESEPQTALLTKENEIGVDCSTSKMVCNTVEFDEVIAGPDLTNSANDQVCNIGISEDCDRSSDESLDNMADRNITTRLEQDISESFIDQNRENIQHTETDASLNATVGDCIKTNTETFKSKSTETVQCLYEIADKKNGKKHSVRQASEELFPVLETSVNEENLPGADSMGLENISLQGSEESLSLLSFDMHDPSELMIIEDEGEVDATDRSNQKEVDHGQLGRFDKTEGPAKLKGHDKELKEGKETLQVEARKTSLTLGASTKRLSFESEASSGSDLYVGEAHEATELQIVEAIEDSFTETAPINELQIFETSEDADDKIGESIELLIVEFTGKDVDSISNDGYDDEPIAKSSEAQKVTGKTVATDHEETIKSQVHRKGRKTAELETKEASLVVEDEASSDEEVGPVDIDILKIVEHDEDCDKNKKRGGSLKKYSKTQKEDTTKHGVKEMPSGKEANNTKKRQPLKTAKLNTVKDIQRKGSKKSSSSHQTPRQSSSRYQAREPLVTVTTKLIRPLVVEAGHTKPKKIVAESSYSRKTTKGTLHEMTSASGKPSGNKVGRTSPASHETQHKATNRGGKQKNLKLHIREDEKEDNSKALKRVGSGKRSKIHGEDIDSIVAGTGATAHRRLGDRSSHPTPPTQRRSTEARRLAPSTACNRLTTTDTRMHSTGDCTDTNTPEIMITPPQLMDVHNIKKVSSATVEIASSEEEQDTRFSPVGRKMRAHSFSGSQNSKNAVSGKSNSKLPEVKSEPSPTLSPKLKSKKSIHDRISRSESLRERFSSKKPELQKIDEKSGGIKSKIDSNRSSLKGSKSCKDVSTVGRGVTTKSRTPQASGKDITTSTLGRDKTSAKLTSASKDNKSDDRVNPSADKEKEGKTSYSVINVIRRKTKSSRRGPVKSEIPVVDTKEDMYLTNVKGELAPPVVRERSNSADCVDIREAVTIKDAIEIDKRKSGVSKPGKESASISKRGSSFISQMKKKGRLGSLSKEHAKSEQKREKDIKEDKENELAELVDGQGGEQLIQRCVIIQRDEKGYGLTVSGDNPVFVQSVKENGAAARAGVRQGDRIIKVNGTLVTNSNHVEVVKLIKSGSYVALTLLGRPASQGPKPVDPAPPGPCSPSVHERMVVSGPHQVDAEKNQEYKKQKDNTLRMMYETTAQEYERLMNEYQKNPSDQLKVKLDEKYKMLTKLMQEMGHSIPGGQSELPIGSAGRSPLSNLPPPGGTAPGWHSAAGQQIRKFESGDGLDKIHEEKEQPPEETLVPQASPAANPAPWLTGGPQHRKTESMPETLYGMEEPLGGGRGVSVTRSHSDSRKRAKSTVDVKEAKSVEELESFKDDIKMRRRKMMQKTVSLPSNVFDTETTSDHSPIQSPISSPSPMQAREAWSEPTADTSDDFINEPVRLSQESPGVSVSGGSTSPPIHPRSSTLKAVLPQQAMVICVEEEDFSTDEEHLDDQGIFSNLDRLMHKPAHMAVFLHYLISNSDPSPLLFYIVSESISQGNLKEMRKWAYEIHSTFLVEKAPLRVNVDEETVASIDYILLKQHTNEEYMRTIFQNARALAQNEIGELLADFRNKRALGLGSLYGVHELDDDNMDKQAELRIIEKYLWPHFSPLIENKDASDRDRAMASALATFLKQVGSTGSRNSSSAIDRCPSFVAKDKKMLFRKSNRKAIDHKGHHFQPQHYFSVMNCSFCQNILWGIGSQGYQCLYCEYNIHKTCIQMLQEACTGIGKKKREKRTSMLDKIYRKPTTTNPAAIREAQRLHQEQDGYSSPTSGSAVHVRSGRDDDDEDIVREIQRLEEDNTFNVQRTVSLPSVYHPKSSTKTNTFYMRKDYGLRILDHMRGSHRVGKLVEQYSDMGRTPEDGRMPATPPRSKSPMTTDIDDPGRKGTHLGRSESLNKKKESRKSVRRTISDVQVDEQTIKSLNQSGSSSNSSLSTRSLDSPSNSNEVLNEVAPNQIAQQSYDSDFDTEVELPPLHTQIPKEVIKKLKPKERKRQDVLNELLYTERAHVRDLKVMQKLFYEPMSVEPSIPQDLVRLLFPNIEQLVEVHKSLNNAFKAKKRENPVIGEVGEVLLKRFEGEAGETFKKVCATFCCNQSHGLDELRRRQDKDQKLKMFLAKAASDPLCRRLALKDLIPKQMQRLTKYPLLIENQMKYTQLNAKEHENLKKALTLSKSILYHVNQAVKDCENRQKLVDLQKRMDRRPIESSSNPAIADYKNLDLTRHKMIHDGFVTWRIARQKQIDLHMLLFEDILVLLQKLDDKLILRCQSTTLVATKFTHSPVIKLTNLLIRNVATDKRAFFLVSTSDVGPQIYELVANSTDEKKKWFKYITEATDGYKNKERRQPRNTKVAGAAAAVAEVVSPTVVTSTLLEEPTEVQTTKLTSEPESTNLDESAELSQGMDKSKSVSSDSLGNMEGKVELLQEDDELQLIQPNEVVISGVTLVERVETLPSSVDMLKEKDEVIQKAMEEKRRLLGEILHVPAQDYDTIIEMSGVVAGEKDAKELVVASIEQVNTLSTIVNQGMKAPDKDVEVTEESDSEDARSLAKTPDVPKNIPITLPAEELLSVQKTLSDRLSQLLEIIEKADEERKRLQSQLSSAQEQISALQLAGRERISEINQPSMLSLTSETIDTVEEETPTSSGDESVAMLTSPSTPVTAVIQHAVEVEVERLEVCDIIGSACDQSASADEDDSTSSVSDDDAEHFTDAETDRDQNSNEQLVIPTLSESCETTDTDLTENTATI